jgi:peptidoglycan/xylan/chitin deacetylase (PgdA/CDA1 family)
MKSNSENISSSRRFVMSVDVDSWSSLLRFYSVDHNPSCADLQANVEDGLEKLLNLFEKHGVKATFFVPGEVAQKHFRTIKAIAEDGHEVACHGLSHEKNECVLCFEDQKARIEKATSIIESVTGTKPSGFRAPCLRANNATLQILNELEFSYDSSFLPMLIPNMYGSFSTKSKPYYPLSNNRGILEIPVSTNPIIPLPLSGSWMRNLGLSWIKLGTKMLFNLGHPVIIYIHPRDVVSLPSMPKVPWHVYRKTGNHCLKMLDELLGYVRLLGGKTLRAIDLASEIKSQGI